MSMRFCKECNNMLKATENKDNQLLKFYWTLCNYEYTVEKNNQDNNLVYRNEIKLGQKNEKFPAQIIDDPTYPRTENTKCPSCGYNKAIFFQNPNINDPGMKLIYVCCNKKKNGIEGFYCGEQWTKDENNELIFKDN